MPGISHVTRGKRINLVGAARERHFSPGYDLFMTLSLGNISHEYPQNAILNSASGFINNERQTLYYNISDVGRCVIVDVMSG